MAGTRAQSPLRNNLGRNLRAYRKRMGLTQEQLSERSGLHQTYLSDVERARRNVTLDVVERLAAAVMTSPIELLSDNLQPVEADRSRHSLPAKPSDPAVT